MNTKDQHKRILSQALCAGVIATAIGSTYYLTDLRHQDIQNATKADIDAAFQTMDGNLEKMGIRI